MKNKTITNNWSGLLYFFTVLFFIIPLMNFGQAPNLGTAVNFVLFSSNGAVTNNGITHLTGNVGTNSGSSTGFGNVDGAMHDNDLVSAQCAADLAVAYGDLNSAIPTGFPGLLLGNGVTLAPGVYSIPAAASLNLELILDGQGDPDALFIFQVNGSFSANANSAVKLINGTQACNVFWKIEGLVDLSAGTSMKGTIVANNAAILMNAGDTLEGRALSIAGAVSVDGVYAYLPIGCGSVPLTGPTAPALASTACYTIFSGDGPVTNAGITFVTGDVGTNVGLTTGYNPSNVAGMVHPIPDASTATAAADLLNVYTYLNALVNDIELLYPAQFGNNLVLTPHVYIMSGAATFTDTLYLNAQGDPDAVFVIKVNGAFSTSTYSKVILINGAQAKNIYWKVDGAVDIGDYSIFRGTLVCNNGAIDLATGVVIDGRAMTTTGAVNTSAISANMTDGCGTIYPPGIVSEPADESACIGQNASFTVIATGSGLTYQWRKGSVYLADGGSVSGANTPTLTINPVSGSDYGTDYNVIVNGTSPVPDTSDNISLLPCIVGIDSYEAGSAIVASIYPNPFTGSIHIALSENPDKGGALLRLYNLQGEEVLTIPLHQQLTLLETGVLCPGIYFYKITGRDNILQAGKLVAL